MQRNPPPKHSGDGGGPGGDDVGIDVAVGVGAEDVAVGTVLKESPPRGAVGTTDVVPPVLVPSGWRSTVVPPQAVLTTASASACASLCL